jgi:hypothetical protein
MCMAVRVLNYIFYIKYNIRTHVTNSNNALRVSDSPKLVRLDTSTFIGYKIYYIRSVYS